MKPSEEALLKPILTQPIYRAPRYIYKRGPKLPEPTAGDVERARKLYHSGMTLSEVAEKLNRSLLLLRRQIPNDGKPHQSRKMAARVKARREGNLAEYLKTLPPTRRDPAKRVWLRNDKIYDLFQQGKNVHQLSKQFDLGVPNISQILDAVEARRANSKKK